MLRNRLLCLAVAAGALIACAGFASAEEAYTTRIEPRPFYGATVTIEEGVRVFRPLPPERQVIINPNRTPISLGFNDTRIYDQRTIERSAVVGSDDTGVSVVGPDGPLYNAPLWGRHFRNGSHFGHHGYMPGPRSNGY